MNISKVATFFSAIVLSLTMVACSKNNAPEFIESNQGITSSNTEEVVTNTSVSTEKATIPTEETTEVAPTEEITTPTSTDFPDNTILVKVNGKEITSGDILNELKEMLKMDGAPKDQLDGLAELYFKELGSFRNSLKDKITEILLLEEVSKRGIVVTDADVDKEIEKIKGQIPPESGITFDDYLANRNSTLDELKATIKEKLPIYLLLDEIREKDIVIADEEILKVYNANKDAFYEPEEVETSHILIMVDADATPEKKSEAKTKCEALLAQIKAGADFATLAKENSDCPSKEKGGELGYFTRGQMVPEFENVAFSLEKGTISDVVETEFGYHIIKVTDKKESHTKTLEEVKNEIEKTLVAEKGSDRVYKFLENLEKAATIEYTDDYQQLIKSLENFDD